MRLWLPALALLLPLAPLPSQTVGSFSPADAITAGPTNTGISGLGFAFGSDASRFQQIYNHDSFTTPVTQPILINFISFRMPALPAGANTGGQGGQWVDIAMDLSLAPLGVNATTMTPTFAQNIDPTTTKRVFRTRSVNLPILGTPANPSTGFDFRFPVDPGQTFIYLPINQQALVLDIYNYTFKPSAYTYYVDGWTRARSGVPGGPDVAMISGALPRTGGLGSVRTSGTYGGCLSSASQVVTQFVSPLTLLPGARDHQILGNCFVPSLPGVLSLGLRPTNIPLPGTACVMANDLLFAIGFVSDTSGEAALPLPIPDDPSLINATFLSQLFWVDLRANALGVVSSHSLESQIGLGFPAGINAVTRGRGLITHFSPQ